MYVRPRPVPFVVSLLTHGLILGWVASGRPGEEQKSVYAQTIAPHASKLVWYNFRQKLPDVSPIGPRALTPPRVEFKIAGQEIVAGSPQAPRARQFVWQPAPKVELKQDLESPNVLAFHPPQVTPPPKPKLFTPPTEAPKPAAELRSLAAPPELRNAALPSRTPVDPALARPEPKKFTAPEVKKAAVPAPKLDAPPEIHVARNLSGAGSPGNPLGLQPVRPPTRTFVAPRAGQGGVATPAAVPAPPRVESAANLGAAQVPLGGGLARPERRAFVPPGGGGGKPSPMGPPLTDAPVLEAGSLSDVSMAIVGLNPSANATAPVPPGSRNGQFSAGPQPRANGGAGGSVDGAMLTVPGLLIRNGAADAKPTLMARAAPTSTSNLRAAVRASLPGTAVPGPHTPAVRVSSAPDASLQGRDVYAMSVQMPNVTSYSGSWMIWFAERKHQFGGTVPGASGAGVIAPVPLRKVDPKYLPSAIADGVEGNVRLAAVIRKDGHVDSVTLLHHLDDRLDQSAAEAIDKWEFEPALRNGKPVDVDAVIEIPFRLAPKVAH